MFCGRPQLALRARYRANTLPKPIARCRPLAVGVHEGDAGRLERSTCPAPNRFASLRVRKRRLLSRHARWRSPAKDKCGPGVGAAEVARLWSAALDCAEQDANAHRRWPPSIGRLLEAVAN